MIITSRSESEYTNTSWSSFRSALNNWSRTDHYVSFFYGFYYTYAYSAYKYVYNYSIYVSTLGSISVYYLHSFYSRDSFHHLMHDTDSHYHNKQQEEEEEEDAHITTQRRQVNKLMPFFLKL